MLFNSFIFILVFLPISSLIFYIFQRHSKRAIYSLVLLSFVFYAYHSIHDLILMIGSIIFNFYIGKNVFQNKKRLIFGLFINIGLIFYFKYAFFAIDNINRLFNLSIHFVNMALPLGISFFTFQQIAYLVDTYKGNPPETNISKYALLVSFFPHSIAGPLVQYKEIAPQFENAKITLENVSIGGSIFIIGLFKKIIIADGLAPCANLVFDSASQGLIPSFAEAWFGAISYSLQLYFDFSGYSDMAIGLAKIFNISFPINFDSPYKATSIIDFWRRWHITLSNFLKNYVYIPLGGNKNSLLQRYRNLLLTMLIGGMWHGANWTFILWGGLHGCFLVINHVWIAILKSWHIKITNSFYDIASWLLTLIVVMLAWVMFRSSNIETARIMYSSLFGFNGISVGQSVTSLLPTWSIFIPEGFFPHQIFYFLDYLPLMTIGLVVSLYLPNIKDLFKHQHHINSKSTRIHWIPSLSNAILMAFFSALAIMVMLSQRKMEFLYFNF